MIILSTFVLRASPVCAKTGTGRSGPSSPHSARTTAAIVRPAQWAVASRSACDNP